MTNLLGSSLHIACCDHEDSRWKERKKTKIILSMGDEVAHGMSSPLMLAQM
jgi:hypothetical protein